MYYTVLYKKGIIFHKTVPMDNPTPTGPKYKCKRVAAYSFEAKPSQRYKLELVVKDDRFRFYVDDVLRIDVRDTQHPGPGLVGMNVMEGIGRLYDFRVTPVD